MKKIRLVLILTMIFTLMSSMAVFAAKGSFTVSKSSVSLTEGGSTTFSINASNCEGQFTIVSSNPNVVKVSSSSVWVTGSETITLTAVKAGTANVTITAKDVGDTDENEVVGSRQISVTVKAPSSNGGNNGGSTGGNNGGSSNNGGSTTTTPKSNNASLKSMWITPKEYDFTGFKAGNLSYSVTVPNEVKSITIAASKGQAGQTISGTGKKTLKEGTNKFNIVVTAEDGKTKKTYTLTAVRKATETEVPNVIENQPPVDKKVDLLLQKLEITGITLSPVFSSEVYEYTAELIEDLTEVEVIATANKTDAIVEITGNTELKEGENIITVTVKSKDGLDTKTYTIKLNKKVEEEAEEVIAVPVLSNNDNNNDIEQMLKNSFIYRIIFIISTIAITIIGIYTLVQERKYVGSKAKYVSKRMRI